MSDNRHAANTKACPFEFSERFEATQARRKRSSEVVAVSRVCRAFYLSPLDTAQRPLGYVMNRNYRQTSNELSLDHLSLNKASDDIDGGGQSRMSQKVFSPIRLLIFTCDASLGEALAGIASEMGVNPIQTNEEVSRQRILQLDAPNIIFVDASTPDRFELKHLLCLRITFPKARIVIATSQGSIPPKIAQSNLQPCNYLRRPFGPNELRLILASCCKCWVADADNRVLSAPQRTYRGLGNIIGRSPVM